MEGHHLGPLQDMVETGVFVLRGVGTCGRVGAGDLMGFAFSFTRSVWLLSNAQLGLGVVVWARNEAGGPLRTMWQ